jgi:hypothetical protein
MTIPGKHNDSYASTCHRVFFKNHKEGAKLSECADNGSNVESLDALSNIVPVIIRHINS